MNNLHIGPEFKEDYGLFTKVYECKQCGVIGDWYYYHNYGHAICPNCGHAETNEFIARWEETESEHFCWYKPWTWFAPCVESEGQWVSKKDRDVIKS